jgi:hypothetical protein
MMQRCGGKGGCTNQIVSKKGEKPERLSSEFVPKRFTDNWGRKGEFFKRKFSNNFSNNRKIQPEDYQFLIIIHV